MLNEMLRIMNPFRTKFMPYKVLWAEDSYYKQVEETELQVSKNYSRLKLNNPFSLYEELIERLRGIPYVEFQCLRNFQKACSKEKIVVGLRHDMDANITGGIKCAKYLARYGIPSTFFVLHTSHYYGYFKDDIFYRNSDMEQILLNFIVAGCELGLHADPLSVYIEHMVDGAAAVRTELEWLRSVGTRIDGTAAHNSAPLYGAENFEIFKQKPFQKGTFLKYKNLKVPLQVLDQNELRLNYEANFAKPKKNLNEKLLKQYFNLPLENTVFNEEWMKFYLNTNPSFERDYDYTIWLNGKNSWVVSGHKTNKGLFLWNIKSNQLLKLFYGDTLVNKKVIFVMHPCFFEITSDG